MNDETCIAIEDVIAEPPVDKAGVRTGSAQQSAIIGRPSVLICPRPAQQPHPALRLGSPTSAFQVAANAHRHRLAGASATKRLDVGVPRIDWQRLALGRGTAMQRPLGRLIACRER
jgi:hypothetical protein